MFYRVLAWYRGLGGWQYVAWIVVAVVAVVSVAVFAIPWLTSSKLRKQVRELKADAALGKAKHEIAASKAVVQRYKDERDQALVNAQAHAEEEKEVDDRIDQIDEQLIDDQNKVQEQTDGEQADWFNKRYNR
jgi:hypothetical protein